MRKLLVRHFVAYWRVQRTWTRIIAEHILLPIGIAVAFLAPNPIVLMVIAALTAILWVLPLKKHEIKYPRAGRKIFYYILAAAILNISYDESPLLLAVTGIGLLPLLWVSFNGWKLSYFDLWPIKESELDADQLKDWEELRQYVDKFKP